MDQVIETNNFMSLGQIKNEIIKLQNQLDFWCKKKKINFEKTQPKTFKLDKIMVDTSHVNNDPLTMYMIKDEECDLKIHSLYESLLSYQQLYRKEIERMCKYDDLTMIVYLKEEQKWSWSMIDKLLHYAEDSSRKKYDRYKKEQKK